MLKTDVLEEIEGSTYSRDYLILNYLVQNFDSLFTYEEIEILKEDFKSKIDEIIKDIIENLDNSEDLESEIEVLASLDGDFQVDESYIDELYAELEDIKSKEIENLQDSCDPDWDWRENSTSVPSLNPDQIIENMFDSLR